MATVLRGGPMATPGPDENILLIKRPLEIPFFFLSFPFFLLFFSLSFFSLVFSFLFPSLPFSRLFLFFSLILRRIFLFFFFLFLGRIYRREKEWLGGSGLSLTMVNDRRSRGITATGSRDSLTNLEAWFFFFIDAHARSSAALSRVSD